MRNIKKIVVHCTAGSQKNKAQDIVDYHTKTLRWTRPGYHYIIEPDGTVVNTWPEEQYSNGVHGYNMESINVCYIGGVDTTKPGLPPVDNRTPQQKASLIALLRTLRRKYPNAEILGHRDLAPKACPSFDARKEYANI